MAVSTFVCLSCLSFIIFALSSLVTGRFCDPVMGILGVRPRYRWLGVPSRGLELGVLFKKKTILWSACPLSLVFFLMSVLN